VFTSTVTMQAGNGSAAFDNITFVDSADVRLHSSAASAGDLYINASNDLAVGGNLSITATTGNITQSGALDIEGTTTLVTTEQLATIDLATNGSGNAFTSELLITTNDNSSPYDTAHVSVDGGTTNLIIGTSTIGGDLTLLSGGTITDTNGSTVTVKRDLSATTDASDRAITLNDLAVDGAFTLAPDGTGAVIIVNDAGLKLAASTMGGTFSGTATTGNITQSGALDIEGTTTLVTTAQLATIDLATNGSGNAFTSELLITTNDNSSPYDTAHVSVDGGTTNLIIGTSTIDGDLTLLSGGTITDTNGSTVTVKGTLTATTDASDRAITLNDLAVDGAFTLAPDGTGAVTIVNDAGLKLAASTMGGTFSGTATTGDISDSGILAITGAATFITTAAGRSIILDQPGSVFTSTVTMQAGNGSAAFDNITFVDSADVRLHSSAASAGDLYINASTDLAVGGNLSITATTGNITQGSEVAVGTTSTFTTSANNATITLNDEDNAFTGALTLTTYGSSANAEIDNGTTILKIAESTVRGNLTLTSGASTSGSNYAIMDTGTLNVSGNLIATTDDNDGVIDLGSLAVNGSFDLTTDGSGNATVVNATALNFIASGIGGNLSATATTGNITQSTGALTVGGTTTLVTTAQGATIELNTITTNAFTGELLITTNDNDSPADTIYVAHVKIDGGTTNLIIGTSTIDGDLTLLSGGTITDTDSSTVTVKGDLSATTDASNSAITLNDLAVTGSVALATNGSGNATVVNDTALDLAASTVGGDLTATATTGDITQSGSLDINGTGTTTITASASGADITLFNAANDFEGAVSTTGHDVNLWTADTMNLGAATIAGDYTVYAGTTIDDSGAQVITGDATFKTHAASSEITFDHVGNSFRGAFITVGGIGYLVNDTSADGIVLIGRTMEGNVIVTAAGPVTQSGALIVGGLTSITATGQNVTLTNASNDFQQEVRLAGANVEVVDTNGIDLGASTVTGTYRVTAGSAVIDSGTLEISGITTITAGSSNNITLDHATNNFAAAVEIASGKDVAITDEDAIILGASTVSGTYDITADGVVTNSGTLEISGITTITAGSGNNITLNSAANNFAAAVKIASGNDVAITDEDTIDLGDSIVSGTYAIIATAGNISDSGTLAITSTSTFTTNTDGADIKLDTTTNRFTGAVTVNTVGAGGDAEIHGGSTPLGIIASGEVGTLKLTTTGADITDSGALVVLGATTIDAGGADVTLNHGSSNLQGAVGASGRNVSLTHPTTIDLGNSTVTGTYGVTATTGNITDSGNLAITGLTTLVTSADGADINLNGTGHTFTGNVKVTTNETGTDADAYAWIDGGSSAGLKIEKGSEVQGDLTLRSGHANTITDEGDSGVVTVDGNLTATTYANNGSITLNDLAVDGTIGLNTHGTGDATVVNDAGFQFAASSVGGNLHATATTGNMTQSGALDIEGTTTLITVANNASITLGTASNAFTGALIITTNDNDAAPNDTNGDVTIHGGTTALVLGNSTIDGDLTLTSTATGTAGITDTGTLNIRGTTTISASGVDVTLNSAANNFQGSIAINGSDVILVNAYATTDLGASTVTGTYTLTASGGVIDSGALAITGVTTVSAGGDVTLNTATNNFQGAVKIDGVNVTVVDAGAIDLGASTVTGTYAVTATAGNITQSGALAITGVTTIAAANGQSIYLDSANTFSSTVAFSSGGTLANVTISDSNDFDFAALALSGNLVAISTGGSITDSGALQISGTSWFLTITSNKDIALDTTTNVFTGAVTLNTTGSTGHAEVDGGTTILDIAASTVGGNLSLTSGHATGITDSGTVTVGGNLIATNDVSNGDINMGSLAVDGTIALTTSGSGGDVTLVNDVGLDFATSNIGGDLAATAITGDISDSGTLTVTGATEMTLGTTPTLTVTGVTSASVDGDTLIILNNSVFTGGITLNYGGELVLIAN